MSNSLRPLGLQHIRLPCPSPSPGVCSNSSPLSQWCHLTISSSLVPFSSHLQSFPALGSFLVSWLFTLRWPKYQSFSFSISPSNEYSGLISLRIDCPCIPKDSKESSPTPQFKNITLWCSAFFIVQLSHPYMTTRKTIALTIWIFVSKGMSDF